jgi:Flp pilus assembly protein TadG
MRSRPTILQLVRRFLRQERGTQLVELALALPMMLMLLGGIAEFGRLFYTYSTLTNSVRAGARHAMRWERTAGWTFPETANMVVYGDFGGSGTAILPGLTTANVDVIANGPANNVSSVTVKIKNYNYQPLFDLGKLTGITSLSLNIPLNASVTMHQLYNGPTAG